ncbi:MAG: type I 3-dehydroquinate dehydratase [Promethearchaeota archaeon]
MNYNICISIPVKTDNIDNIKEDISLVLRAKPDFIEFRLDYVNDPKKLTPEFLNELVRSVNKKVRTIFTLRKVEEGGKMDLSAEEKIEIFKKYFMTDVSFIDMEFLTQDKVLKYVFSEILSTNINLILSYHDIQSTPPFGEVMYLLNFFRSRLIDRLDIKRSWLSECIYKWIFTANKFSDNLIPLNLCQKLSNEGSHIISFCMGELGIFSRVFCVKFGSYMTFASYKEKTAPGQISIEQVKKFLDSFK